MIAALKPYVALIIIGVLIVATLTIKISLYRYGTARYAAGVAAGRQAVLDDDARAAAELQQHIDALNRASAAASASMQLKLNVQLPAIEAKTHDAVTTVRTIYRTLPTTDAGACRRPDGVQQQLDEAIKQANAAADDHL